MLVFFDTMIPLALRCPYVWYEKRLMAFLFGKNFPKLIGGRPLLGQDAACNGFNHDNQINQLRNPGFGTNASGMQPPTSVHH